VFDRLPYVDWPTPYGVMLALACVAAWWVARHRALTRGVDASHVDLALPLALVAGAGLVRLLATVVPDERIVAGTTLLAEHRLRLPAIATVGLVVLFLYCRIAHVSFRRFADSVAPGLLLGIAFLRIGCFLAGCCFGTIAGTAARLDAASLTVRLQLQALAALSGDAIPWAVRFPAGSLAYRQHVALGLIGPGAATSLPVHPVQLYESAAALLLCVLVLRLPVGRLRAGTEALVAFGGYAVIAFVLQFLRADNALAVGPLSVPQLIYLAWLAAVPLLAVAMRSRH
jgi:phosphatidylglycerol---prolipoprotein diacylglyceryl transferase